MICFSILFTLNIAIGNVSLHHVSVNFNQVMRSLVPIITLWCSLVLNKPISRARRMAVWPVVAGVALACYGDRMSVSVIGFGYTLLCVILASVKVVASSELLTGVRQMHPVELLDRMAPLALLQCCLLAFGAGEVQSLKNRPDLNPIVTGDWKPVFLLLFSGFVAFSLNICALQAYKLTSALTCCIAAAVKQVLMIVVGTILFDTPVTLPNGVGIAVVILASTYYSYVSIQEQQVSTQKQEEDGCEDLESGNPDDKALMTSPDDKRGMVRR
jgi:drug/metabolite transporter (DMT)-like permease